MRRIANYIVEDTPLAKGGMGQIFRGQDEYGNTVAIKEILPEFANDWSIIARIEKEVEFLVKIDHPQIVNLYAAFRDKESDCYYIVMEYVKGMNIEQYVNSHGAFTPEKATELMLKILDALQCVHGACIIHRDIKPSNIMIRENGDVCLLDFGVAKDVNNSNTLTVFGSIIGTSGYMSPEQAMGYAIDYRSDIYSVGCVFYYMLTGHHAFNTLSSEFETKDAILTQDFPKLSKYRDDLPDTLQQILDRATMKNMTMRYSNCMEFTSALRNGTFVSNHGGSSLPVKLTFGRELCDIIMNDKDRKISRHHADIELKEFTGGKYFIFTDCSTNGTYIDGRLILKTSERIPASGPYPVIVLAGVPEGRVDWISVSYELEKRRKLIENIPETPEETDDHDKQESDDKSSTLSPEGDNPSNAMEEEGESATTMLIVGAIFAVIGGYFGILIGSQIANQKIKNFDGSKTYKYKKSHRKWGWAVLVVSIIAAFVWTFAKFL